MIKGSFILHPFKKKIGIKRMGNILSIIPSFMKKEEERIASFLAEKKENNRHIDTV
jgi:hypothetical protein